MEYLKVLYSYKADTAPHAEIIGSDLYQCALVEKINHSLKNFK